MKTQDVSNIRYDPLLSAQCKAQCLYEYRNHNQRQYRSLPSMFSNTKSERLLVSSQISCSFYLV